MTLLPFVTHDKKGEVVLDMRVVILMGRVSIGLFVRGSVDIFEGCSEHYLYLFLFSILDTFVLVPYVL